jgi:glyoxylase-like metal-dependent hydrolase (beta-lactamase superfamily II)
MERIQLENTVFEGQNNAYLFDGDRTALIDTGVGTDAGKIQLEQGLADYGLSFADVDTVLLTHYHGDHSGLASDIQAVSGATVHVHQADARLVAGEPVAWDALATRQRDLFDEWGMPTVTKESLVEYLNSGPDLYGESVDVEPFVAGDVFDIGEVELTAIHTPGHTAGLSCFATDDGVVFSGDALLPVYTPNVGGADVRVDRSLERYLKTLKTIADREFDRAWPGHRNLIEDPTARALEVFEHHEVRSRRVLEALQRLGLANAWEVSADLFGDLEEIHVLHGPGEAYAHLEHLEHAGDIERTAGGYRLTPDTEERLDAIDDEGWPL